MFQQIYTAVVDLIYQDFLGVFLTGFCVSLVLPTILLVLGTIVIAGRPRGFGIVYLFWQPQWWRQLTTGLGVGAVVWQTFLAGYLFEPLATNFTMDRPPFCEIQPQTIAGPDVPYQVGPEEGGRLRYPVANVVTIFRYISAVLIGAVIAAALFCVARFVWRRFKRLFRKNQQSMVKTDSGNRPKNPLPYHRGFCLWGGTILGFVIMAGIDHVLLDETSTRTALKETGFCVVSYVGWGQASAREEYLERMMVDPEDTTSKVEPLNSAEQKLTARKYYDANKAKFTDRLRPYFPIFGLFFLNAVAIIGFYAFWLAFRRLRNSVTPATALTCLIQILLLVHVAFSYFVPTPHLTWVLAIMFILAAGVTYKLKFPNLDYVVPASLESAYDRANEATKRTGKPLLLPDEIHPFPSTSKQPMILVCASGGGSRAAAWTMRILTDLEEAFDKQGHHFPYHIRLMTGASGGMIAGAYYVANLDAPAEDGSVRRKPAQPRKATGYPVSPRVRLDKEWTTLDHLNNNIRQDFLMAVARATIIPDLIPSIFVPIPFTYDRGKALEAAWSIYFNGQLDQTFYDLHDGEQEGWRPSLIFSPMTVEDGRQLLITNLDLDRMTENRANRLAPDDDTEGNLLSREGNELFKFFPNAGNEFTLATATRMSATFPFVMPAVELPTNPPLRVVDAGYYDNFGVGVAATWLFTHRQWVRENFSGVVLVQIRDGMSGPVRRREKSPADADGTSSGIGWLTAPLEGLYNMRTYSTAFRNDTLLHLIDQLFKIEQGADGFFQTVEFEFTDGDDVQLNITLTAEECEQIDKAAGGIAITQRIDALLNWWKTR